MNRKLAFASCTAFSLIVAGGLAAGMAQAAPASDTPMLEVVIQAQRLVRHEIGRDSSGVPTELIQLNRRVGYGDLNLTKYSDVTKLKNRISTTARHACKSLAEMYPLVAPNNPDCVKDATEGGMKEAQAVIKLANEKTQG